MANITTQELNQSIKELETLIRLFAISDYDEVTNRINLKISETCDEDTKELFKGLDNSYTIKAKRNILVQFINLTFEKLFLFSHENNIFFNKCSYTVYESTFENRFKDYKITFVDCNVIDFAKQEIEVLVNTTDFIITYFDKTNQKRNIDSFNKKIEFLQLILSDKNITTQIVKKSDLLDLFVNKVSFKQNEPQQPEPESIDLSDTTATEEYLGQSTNENANEFFDFLIQYYRSEDKTQIKYVNILHYLKNDADKKHFIFKVKQSEYKILVNEKTGIDIKKFQKSERYTEEEKPIFHKLENTFLKNKTV